MHTLSKYKHVTQTCILYLCCCYFGVPPAPPARCTFSLAGFPCRYNVERGSEKEVPKAPRSAARSTAPREGEVEAAAKSTEPRSENGDEQIILPSRSHRRCYRMAQGCLKCLKYTMCAANFLCFLCGVAVLSFGVYMMVYFKMATLTPNLAKFNLANMLLISGIVITCVSFLGFLGALKENRCLLLTFFLLLFALMLVELTVACLLLMYEDQIGELVEQDLDDGLRIARGTSVNSTNVMSEWDLLQETFDCCGVKNWTDWGDAVPKSCCAKRCDTATPEYRKQACLARLKNFFEENFLTTGISVIVLCVIEVLGMCFAMTLFCHISRSGLGYKL